MAELLFFTGKGGTGKTTISTLTAITKSLQDKKTLLVSIDPAHSLSDILHIAKSLGINTQNINFIEIDIHHETQSYIRNALKTISRFISREALSKVEGMVKSLAYSPGSEEAVIIEVISKIIKYENNNYDVIIFDTAPSGHTIRLIKDIYSSGKLLKTIYEESKKIAHLKDISGKQEKLGDIPALIKERSDRLKDLEKLIKGGTAEFVVIMNPDLLSFEETKRLVKSLEKIDAKIKALIINKIFTEEFPSKYVEEQNSIIKKIEEYFKDYKIIRMNYCRGENILNKTLYI